LEETRIIINPITDTDAAAIPTFVIVEAASDFAFSSATQSSYCVFSAEIAGQFAEAHPNKLQQRIADKKVNTKDLTMECNIKTFVILKAN